MCSVTKQKKEKCSTHPKLTEQLFIVRVAGLSRHENHHDVDALCSKFRQFNPDLGRPEHLYLYQATYESVPFQVFGLHNAKIIATE
jgi:hypothetical protein